MFFPDCRKLDSSNSNQTVALGTTDQLLHCLLRNFCPLQHFRKNFTGKANMCWLEFFIYTCHHTKTPPQQNITTAMNALYFLRLFYQQKSALCHSFSNQIYKTSDIFVAMMKATVLLVTAQMQSVFIFSFHIRLTWFCRSSIFNSIALRMPKPLWSFGYSECHKINMDFQFQLFCASLAYKI